MSGVVTGSTIANQAQFTATGQVSGQPIAQLSDDPTTPAGPDATRIPTGGAPVLESEKTVVDDNGGTLLVGETVTYTVVVSNRGNVAATGVRIRDPIPTNAAYLSGTRRMPRALPDHYAAGSANEAVCYAYEARNTWRAHAGAKK